MKSYAKGISKKIDFNPFDPIFEPIGFQRLEWYEFLGYTSRPLFNLRACRKKFRRNK